VCISIKQSNALPHEWVGVPKSEYGEQLWDRQSIKRNEDGSVRVLSKYIPKTKSEITKDILYTMDINCFEKSFRDVDVSIDEVNSNFIFDFLRGFNYENKNKVSELLNPINFFIWLVVSFKDIF